MYWVLIGIIVLLAVLLVAVILLQNPKGGLASGVAASQLMGVKRTTDLLERLTWGFAIAIMVLTVGTAFVAPTPGQGDDAVNIRRSRTAPVQTAPAPVQQPAPAPQPADSGK